MGGQSKTKEEIGAMLADDVQEILRRIEYRTELDLAAKSRTIQLPYRKYADDETRGGGSTRVAFR